MRKYILDTNVYIRAIRSEAARVELARWQRRMAPFLFLHTMVVAELLVGARDERTLERWRGRWVEPAERVGRVVAPSRGTWTRAARLVVRSIAAGHLARGAVPPSFLNDCLIAASAREEGLTIVTYNDRDFGVLKRVEPSLDVLAPLP